MVMVRVVGFGASMTDMESFNNVHVVFEGLLDLILTRIVL